MRPILRSIPALALLVAAAGCGAETSPAPKEAQAASTASEPAAAAPSTDPAPAADPAPDAAGVSKTGAPAVVAAADGRPAMLDTGIDLTHLKDAAAAQGGAAFPPASPPATVDLTGPQPAAIHAPPGKLELVEGTEEVHFGELLEGETAETTFRFKSTGENPLIIERVKPSCGCTAAEIQLVDAEGNTSIYELGQPIPAGTELRIPTSINTASRRGQFASNVAVYSNDPSSPLRLQLKADVRPVLEVEPVSLDFGTMTSGDVKEGTIHISSSVLEPFRLELDETRPLEQPLTVELKAIDPDAEGRSRTWELAVKLGPNTAEGMRRYPLRVLTDVPQTDAHGHEHAEGEAEAEAPAETRMRELTCTVTANVTGLVVATPNFISLGVVRPGEPIERTVRIESLDPDFKMPESPAHGFQSLTGGEFGFAEHFTVTTRPVPESDGKAIEMTLRLEGLPEDFNGSFGGMVSLSIGHPTKPDVNVRFSGVARAGIPPAGDNQ